MTKLIVAAIVILLIIFGVWMLNGKNAGNFTNTQNENDESTSTSVDWNGAIPQIRETVKPLEEGIESRAPISIQEQTDITGDGIPEALVDLGTGGAASEEYAVMRMENGKPVVATFKTKEGETMPAIGFLRAASVMHGAGVGLSQKDQAILSTFWEMDATGKNFTSCETDAFKWNGTLFQYNQELSKSDTNSTCSELLSNLRRLQ